MHRARSRDHGQSPDRSIGVSLSEDSHRTLTAPWIRWCLKTTPAEGRGCYTRASSVSRGSFSHSARFHEHNTSARQHYVLAALGTLERRHAVVTTAHALPCVHVAAGRPLLRIRARAGGRAAAGTRWCSTAAQFREPCPILDPGSLLRPRQRAGMGEGGAIGERASVSNDDRSATVVCSSASGTSEALTAVDAGRVVDVAPAVPLASPGVQRSTCLLPRDLVRSRSLTSPHASDSSLTHVWSSSVSILQMILRLPRLLPFIFLLHGCFGRADPEQFGSTPSCRTSAFLLSTTPMRCEWSSVIELGRGCAAAPRRRVGALCRSPLP